ncbi:(2Fe-2S)-binding protein [Paenibacillus luteus]|uniref:(2Fe-2S)-binding protein n=1 Tax=Paenibacillus luteus TaxID=2545753 RepID=UPI001375D2B9|nr:(2Fe-2S)-binding protein [Paenibacillus luteus]
MKSGDMWEPIPLQKAIIFMKNHFRIALDHAGDERYPFTASDLLDPSARSTIFDLQAAQLGHPDLQVVGTLFAKRYSVLFTGLIASMDLFDYPLSSSLGDIRLRIIERAAMEYQVIPASAELLPYSDAQERKVKRTEYSDQLRRSTEALFRSVSAHTGVPPKVMWSLITHQLQQYYARLQNARHLEVSEERISLALADQGILMAEGSDNPLAVHLRSLSHPLNSDMKIYVRRYCCMAFRIKQHGYCSTCPKLSELERRKMLLGEN